MSDPQHRQRTVGHLLRTAHGFLSHVVAGMLSPMQTSAEDGGPRLTWKRMSAGALLCVGLVAQLAALVYLGYLVDLCISLMELWADLARKHLELTL